MLRLENNLVKIEVDPLGAELKSLYSVTREMEYLWQPGHEIWDHSSLLLFPYPGRVKRDRILINGRVCPANMHGFAFRKRFDILAADESRILLSLKPDGETRGNYPYEFELQAEFTLENETLYERLTVFNHGKDRMYFSIGAHPGFYLPLVFGESGEDYVLEFDRPQEINRLITAEKTVLPTNETVPFLYGETRIPLSEGFFNDGPKLLSGVSAESVTLRSLLSGHFVTIGIEGFPYMCLWGNPVQNAVICIEPWCGMSDSVDADQDIRHKTGIQRIDPGKSFSRTLSFRIG